NDRADVDLVRALLGAVAKLAVERAVVANLVVLLARRHPRGRRAELERLEGRLRPILALLMKLVDVAVVGGEKLRVVTARILDVLQRKKRLARKEEVVGMREIVVGDGAKEVLGALGQIGAR